MSGKFLVVVNLASVDLSLCVQLISPISDIHCMLRSTTVPCMSSKNNRFSVMHFVFEGLVQLNIKNTKLYFWIPSTVLPIFSCQFKFIFVKTMNFFSFISTTKPQVYIDTCTTLNGSTPLSVSTQAKRMLTINFVY